MRISFRRRRQVRGAIIGLAIAMVVITWLMLPSNESYSTLGPANTGHAELKCQDCHEKAPGTPFDQFMANVNYTLGMRRSEVEFGHKEVTTKSCLSCHDRPNDRHPTHRFKEPRFSDARKEIQATECETCHLEHKGLRMTYQNTTFCVSCHADLEMKNDPLDVSHTELIKEEKWQTCIQCHDFHGNHVMKTATLLKDTIPLKKIVDYIEGGDSPFSQEKKYKAKKSNETGK